MQSQDPEDVIKTKPIIATLTFMIIDEATFFLEITVVPGQLARNFSTTKLQYALLSTSISTNRLFLQLKP